jgi:phosphatidylglycerophosphate synthase
MFLSGSLMLWISGYILYQLYYVLDCSDGEVAVATGNTSDFGAFLDKISHPITNSAIIYFSAFGAYRITGSLPLLVISASGAIMFNLTSVMRCFVRSKTDSGSENKEGSGDTGHKWFAEEDSSLVKLLKVGKNLATRPGGLTHPLAFLLLLDVITGGAFRVIYPAAASFAATLLVLKRFRGIKEEMS